MIVGKGDIASVLPHRDDLLFFAAGVSNSGETDENEYKREIEYLRQVRNTFSTPHLVYFSSLCVFYGSNRYCMHKREMESIVKRRNPYTIIRLGNITWGNNPHTLLNFIRNKILHYEPIEIRDEYRYLVTKEEFLYWINLIPPWSCEINIVGRTMKVKDIVREYCYPWGKSNGTAQHDNSESELPVRLTDCG